MSIPVSLGQFYLIDTSAHARSDNPAVRNILHYDADFEHIAAATAQPHAWIVP